MSTERVNEVKIKLSASGVGSVEIGGHNIAKDVKGLRFSGTAGQPVELSLEMAPRAITIDAAAMVVIDGATKAVLLALGWTPPGDRPDDFAWLTKQLAQAAAELEGPITPERWTEIWVDTRNALREEGESEANAAVLADHHVLEHFGPRPEGQR